MRVREAGDVNYQKVDRGRSLVEVIGDVSDGINKRCDYVFCDNGMT
jgi:hypothetical protein